MDALRTPINDPALFEQADRLKQALVAHFDDNELMDVAWQMEINYDDLPGDSLTTRAIQLVRLAQRRNLVGALQRVIRRMRPDADV